MTSCWNFEISFIDDSRIRSLFVVHSLKFMKWSCKNRSFFVKTEKHSNEQTKSPQNFMLSFNLTTRVIWLHFSRAFIQFLSQPVFLNKVPNSIMNRWLLGNFTLKELINVQDLISTAIQCSSQNLEVSVILKPGPWIQAVSWIWKASILIY